MKYHRQHSVDEDTFPEHLVVRSQQSGEHDALLPLQIIQLRIMEDRSVMDSAAQTAGYMPNSVHNMADEQKNKKIILCRKLQLRQHTSVIK